MIHKIINSVMIIAIVLCSIIVMSALKMAFTTVNDNINTNKKSLVTLHGNQEEIISSTMDIIELMENISNQLFINQVEISRLKNELGIPNDLEEQTEELYNILAEE